ncbi:hypothetical protein K0U83_17090, partial [bacterium]|nr:hypothetical protein [bacterium]
AISLPLASNFTSSGDLSGSGGAWGCRATADTTNDRAAFTINNSVTGATAAALNFQYRML